MKVNIFDFPVGSVRLSTDSSMDANLGVLATGGDKIYRLVKANAAISTPTGKAVTCSSVALNASGTKSWSVDLPAAANSNIDGLIPTSYGSTTIASGSYFWIQVSGVGSGLAATTTVVGNSTTLSQVTATTAGWLTPLTAGVDAVIVMNCLCGAALNTAVVTAGAAIPVQLNGLI
jgi:hypothetical protein